MFKFYFKLLRLESTRIAGIYWKGGRRQGAIAGLIAGMTVWLYTLALPGLFGIEAMQAARRAGGAAPTPPAATPRAVPPVCHRSVSTQLATPIDGPLRTPPPPMCRIRIWTKYLSLSMSYLSLSMSSLSLSLYVRSLSMPLDSLPHLASIS